MKAERFEVLSFDELCEFLKISRSTADALHRRGEGPPYLVIGRRRRYPVAALRNWLDEKSGR